jgi:beta-phosphoglucomutase-like phosphatase (HAD superfamily)
MDQMGVGEMGIVEDAIDGVETGRNARMETHVYSDLWRTTVRRTRWVQSIHRKNK